MFIDKFDFLIPFIVAIVITFISTIYSVTTTKNSNKKTSASEKIIYELKKVADNSAINVSAKKFEKEKYDNKVDELIKIYHEQALSQAKIQFWFSLITAIIGFIVIICVFFFTQGTVWYEHIIKILPGGIIEVMSVLFFVQSRKTSERSSDFLNRLRVDSQYEKSISIVETITDGILRDNLKGEIALHLCDIQNINFTHISNNDTAKTH